MNEKLRNKLGGINIEDEKNSDNLAIALCSYFETHQDRPEHDPIVDSSWGEWVTMKANRALEKIGEAFSKESP